MNNGVRELISETPGESKPGQHALTTATEKHVKDKREDLTDLWIFNLNKKSLIMNLIHICAASKHGGNYG